MIYQSVDGGHGSKFRSSVLAYFFDDSRVLIQSGHHIAEDSIFSMAGKGVGGHFSATGT